MTLKQDMKVYYETFPESLYRCDFCTRNFRTLAGLRNHAVRMHAVEMDATREAFKYFADTRDAWNDVATDVPEHEDRHLGPCSTDTSGRCACVHEDARSCYLIRYSVDPADDDLDDQRCECRCHIDHEDSHYE